MTADLPLASDETRDVADRASKEQCKVHPGSSLEQSLSQGDFYHVLISPLARSLLGHNKDDLYQHLTYEDCGKNWSEYVNRQLKLILTGSSSDSTSVVRADLFAVGIAALHSFLQLNVTGPPLAWPVDQTIISDQCRIEDQKPEDLRRQLISSLSVDGEAIYHLTPQVELFCLAKLILNNEKIVENEPKYVQARLRVNFWHQRMLNENAASLQTVIYHDLDDINRWIQGESSGTKAEFLVERATIHIHHGLDSKAQEDLQTAARERNFDFILTGRLGKRTKFQHDELSQLVVLARSTQDGDIESSASNRQNTSQEAASKEEAKPQTSKPLNLDLNDDTLLESISFSKQPSTSSVSQGEEELPQSLRFLDPADQPALQPLDSAILLALVSSITNTAPQDGLTREETLPYATRVLAGHSTNWQVYTQALLVRSRIEGFRSRTVERGVLQLQAVLDQVIAETTIDQSSFWNLNGSEIDVVPSSTTFLPRPKPSESASVSERLLYIHQLAPPTRWKLEAELANRWVSLGGLRTAREIFERLEMWAEVALCWAANDREDEALKIVRQQLFDGVARDQTAKATGMSDGSSI